MINQKMTDQLQMLTRRLELMASSVLLNASLTIVGTITPPRR